MSQSGGSWIAVVGCIGLLASAPAFLGTRHVLRTELLIPQCRDGCAGVGLSYANIANTSVRGFRTMPDTCICRRAGPQAPSGCREVSSVNLACDGGVWFGWGRVLTEGAGMSALLLPPIVLLGVVGWLRLRRSRRETSSGD